MEGIDQLKKAGKGLVLAVNAQQLLAGVDWKLAAKQALDMDANEAKEVAAEVGILDLNDDAFEVVVKGAVSAYGEYAAVFMRILRMILPK